MPTKTVLRPTEVLLTGLIDYAGLFPPAALDMATAVRNYAAYLAGPHAAWLGRFVVTVARLEELEAALVPPGQEIWQLSAIMSADVPSDMHRIERFNQAHDGAAVIDTVEMKVAHAADIQHAMAQMPGALTPYLEVPIEDDPSELIAAIAWTGARAKVRTGGVTAEAFPSSASLARFLVVCAKENVAFKATAGLHHPLRGSYRLTYEPDSARASMHGFLNVFLGAVAARRGAPVSEITELLDEQSPEAFDFGAEGVQWRQLRLGFTEIEAARSQFSISFGSCSFEEPVEDLHKIGLL